MNAALVRELREELGAEIEASTQVYLVSSPASDEGVSVQHFLVRRLLTLDIRQRSGPEYDDPSRGGHASDRVDLLNGGLRDVDLKPTALKDLILANDAALTAAAGTSKEQT